MEDSPKVVQFGLSHFKKPTPSTIETVGNWCLIGAFVAGSLVVPPLSGIIAVLVPAHAVEITTVATACVSVTGIAGKLLTKFFGYKPKPELTDLTEDSSETGGTTVTPSNLD